MSVTRYCHLGFALAIAVEAGSLFAAQTITEPFLGVRHIHQTETTPRPLNIHVVEIDLTAPGISFRMSPRSPAYPGPEINGQLAETTRQTTRQFANAVGAQVAINASFYASEATGTWANNSGLTVSNGDKYSPWDPGPNDNDFDDALNITQTNLARFVKKPDSYGDGFQTLPTVALYNAVTGNHRLLQSNVNVAPTSCSVCSANPRTAVGLTANNAKLLLMTVDGRQQGFSEGLTLVELADWMKTVYGATNAINLDGGGSTTMVMNNYSDGAAAQVLNVPSDGSERSVGNSLALFVLPNGDFNQNGGVDAADYVVWRKTIGGQMAYDAWSKHFGAPASGLGGEAPVPEPSTWIFSVLAVCHLVRWRRSMSR